MKFSIVVPIYNISKYLPECLNSIKNQTYDNFECIMVDDGSTDECSEICDDFVGKDSRFRVIHKENGGLVSARKAGAEIATGDYILNIDGDDYVNDDILKVMFDIIEEHNPEAIYFGYKVFGMDRNKIYVNECSTGLYDGEKVDYLKDTYLYNKNVKGLNSGSVLFSICAKCVRRDLYCFCQNKVPNDIVSGEDTVFTMWLSKKINKVYVSDYVGYNYRMVETSIEHGFSIKKFDDLHNTYEVLHNLAEDDDVLQNSVNVYLIYRIWFYLCGMAVNAKNYFSYRKSIGKTKECLRWMNGHIEIFHNMHSKIKFLLVKNKLYLPIYFLAKFVLEEIC